MSTNQQTNTKMQSYQNYSISCDQLYMKVKFQEIHIYLLYFSYTDKLPGFFRKIQKEEYWLYNFPKTESYYPSEYLWVRKFYAFLKVLCIFESFMHF